MGAARRAIPILLMAGAGLASAACGDASEGRAVASSIQPVGEVQDLSAPGMHQLPDPPLGPREGGIRVWTGDRLVMWGGATYEESHSEERRLVADGAVLDLDDGRWTPMAPSPFPQGLYHPLGAWDGDEVIVIGTECEPVVPPPTEGGPPACPGGPAAAAWSPSTQQWRLLPDPPIPPDPHYDEPVLERWLNSVHGDGTALFSFGTNGTTIVWLRDSGSWTTVETPWGPGDRITTCADPVRSQLVAATSWTDAGTSRAWRLPIGDSEWSGPVPLGVPVQEDLSCGDGHVVLDSYGTDGSAGHLIDVATGERSPAFEPTPPSELRHAWAVAEWIFSGVLTGMPPDMGGSHAVRRVDGDRWNPLDDRRLGSGAPGAAYVGNGLVGGFVGPDGGDLFYWRAPEALTG